MLHLLLDLSSLPPKARASHNTDPWAHLHPWAACDLPSNEQSGRNLVLITEQELNRQLQPQELEPDAPTFPHEVLHISRLKNPRMDGLHHPGLLIVCFHNIELMHLIPAKSHQTHFCFCLVLLCSPVACFPSSFFARVRGCPLFAASASSNKSFLPSVGLERKSNIRNWEKTNAPLTINSTGRKST